MPYQGLQLANQRLQRPRLFYLQYMFKSLDLNSSTFKGFPTMLWIRAHTRWNVSLVYWTMQAKTLHIHVHVYTTANCECTKNMSEQFNKSFTVSPAHLTFQSTTAILLIYYKILLITQYDKFLSVSYFTACIKQAEIRQMKFLWNEKMKTH